MLAILFAAGTLLALLGRPGRLGLFPSAAVVLMLLANAALSGPEARFRYPIDPLIGVVAAGGLVGAVSLLKARTGPSSVARARPVAWKGERLARPS